MVFSFNGFLSDDPQQHAKQGFAVAESSTHAIDCMREFGFVITSISSLDDVLQSVEIMKHIASGSDEVEESEYVCALPATAEAGGVHSAHHVFSFQGYSLGHDSSDLKAGFAVALDPTQLQNFLLSFGFVADAIVSLADLLPIVDEMLDIAEDPQSEHCSCVNLLETLH